MPKINFIRVLGVVCAVTLAAATLLSYVHIQTEHIEDSVLRLHIVANSNSEEDQSLKLKIRDEVIDRCGFLFRNCQTAEQSVKTAHDNIGFITYVAREAVAANGYDYPVTCSVEQCGFPTKYYESKNGGVIALPRGEYNAVNIKIGEADGQNWWCVMYPPLCFVDGVVSASDEADSALRSSLTASEYKLITDGSSPSVQVKFKIAEILGK